MSSDGRPAAPRLLVPAYAHPADAPQLWSSLVAGAAALRLVVVNPHDGPGAQVDPAYPPVLAGLSSAGVRCAGYVDTGYGARPPADVAADVATYVDRHGLDAVFLDQVSSGLDQLEHYAGVVRLARAAGARSVVLNPGTQPHQGYVELANLTVTFEGPWSRYAQDAAPVLARPGRRARVCHLVHSVPRTHLLEALDAVSAAGACAVMATDGTGPNPWDRLPEPLLEEVLRRGRADERAPAARPRPTSPLRERSERSERSGRSRTPWRRTAELTT